MNALTRGLITAAGLVALWQALVWLSSVPPFLLPGPARVASTWWARADLITGHAWITLAEILLGLTGGVMLGALSALTMTAIRGARAWLMPLLVMGQALPVFAIAPLLTLWFGYGMASKVVMAILIVYFPVTAALYDGLRRTEPGWLDLAATMNATPWRVLRHVRLPAALPAFASGLRIAAAAAPIGAIVGEWVGSARGLGYLMLHANARAQTDLMFAALLTLMLMALALYAVIDTGLKRALPWVPERDASS